MADCIQIRLALMGTPSFDSFEKKCKKKQLYECHYFNCPTCLHRGSPVQTLINRSEQPDALPDAYANAAFFLLLAPLSQQLLSIGK